MNILCCWLRRQIAIGLVAVLTAPLLEAAALPPQQPPTDQQSQNTSSTQDHSQNPNSPALKPSTQATEPNETVPDLTDPAPIQAADPGGQSVSVQPDSKRPRNSAPKPVGTAAAPYEKSTGVAASRPAGAVIAPARQRRARSFLIKVGVVVGAAVAIGTVVALSHGSPSRP